MNPISKSGFQNIVEFTIVLKCNKNPVMVIGHTSYENLFNASSIVILSLGSIFIISFIILQIFSGIFANKSSILL